MKDLSLNSTVISLCYRILPDLELPSSKERFPRKRKSVQRRLKEAAAYGGKTVVSRSLDPIPESGLAVTLDKISCFASSLFDQDKPPYQLPQIENVFQPARPGSKAEIDLESGKFKTMHAIFQEKLKHCDGFSWKEMKELLEAAPHITWNDVREASRQLSKVHPQCSWQVAINIIKKNSGQYGGRAQLKVPKSINTRFKKMAPELRKNLEDRSEQMSM